MQTRTLRSVVYFTAGLGLILSLFAAAEFYDASLRAVCNVNGYIQCGKVDSSGLTTIFSVQDYYFGIAGFVLILVVAVLSERRAGDPRFTYALLAVTTLGVGVALYLLYVEVGEIHALCPVCVGAYAMGVASWAGAVGLARRRPDEEEWEDEDVPDAADDPPEDPPAMSR
jgi:uncharacterized membrane protein